MRYRINVRGRPATPGKPQGTPGTREVDEGLVDVGMTSSEKDTADIVMIGGARGILPADRVSRRAAEESVRDDISSEHHQINEAIRMLDALDIVEAE